MAYEFIWGRIMVFADRNIASGMDICKKSMYYIDEHMTL